MVGNDHSCRNKACLTLCLYRCDCCCRPVLIVYSNCSNCVASLVDCHLSCHVHKDLGLRASLDMCCRNHSCGYGASVHCHTVPLELLRCPTSSGRADHSYHSSCLTSSRHGNFRLRCTCHCPRSWSHIIARKNTNLARVHGSSLEPAILAAFKYQEHFSLPQFQFILFSRSIRVYSNIYTWTSLWS